MRPTEKLLQSSWCIGWAGSQDPFLAFLRVCMIFLSTFIAKLIFPAAEFSMSQVLTLKESDMIRDKL